MNIEGMEGEGAEEAEGDLRESGGSLGLISKRKVGANMYAGKALLSCMNNCQLNTNFSAPTESVGLILSVKV